MTKAKQNIDITDSVSPNNAPDSPDFAAMAKRRRFIRLGASTVPVAMTLASRPVLAWHCNSTSAWGSAQMAGGVGSAETRRGSTVTQGNECWSIANWKGNDRSGSNMGSNPWDVVMSKLSVATVDLAKTNLKVSAIFPSLIRYGGDTTVWSIVNGSSSWQQSVTVARLNSIYAEGYKAKIDACVVSNSTGPNGGDQIIRMAGLGPGQYFSPNSPTYKWTALDITGYLSSNWLAH